MCCAVVCYAVLPCLQVGAASDHDLVVLKGQLEEARAEAVSASRQWAAEREQLVAAAQGMWSELQRCHEALQQAVGQVGCTTPCRTAAVLVGPLLASIVFSGSLQRDYI